MADKLWIIQLATLLLALAAAIMPTIAEATAPPPDSQLMRHTSLPHTEFHLFARQHAASQQASEAFCHRHQLLAVSTREVRYFWKQLPYNISFYLGSRIEMTTDHPEIERGEVLCFPLRRINLVGNAAAAYDALHALHKTSAGAHSGGTSCRTPVTSVLCKRQTTGSGNCTTDLITQLLPPPLSQNQQQQQQQQQQQKDQQGQGQVTFKSADGSVCLSGPLFWTLTTGTGALILLLTAVVITLAACSVRFKRQLNNSFGYQCLSRQASARLMMHQAAAANKHLGIGGGSHVSGAALDTEDGGGFFL